MPYSNITTPSLRLLTTGCLLFACHATMASLVVIGNKNAAISSLSASNIKNLYLGKTKEGNGKRLYAFNQPEGSATYQKFYSELLDWTPAQISSYWSRQVFAGKASQLQIVSGNQQALATVNAYASAIAYIDSASLSSSRYPSVRTLYRLSGTSHSPTQIPAIASTHAQQDKKNTPTQTTQTKTTKTKPSTDLANNKKANTKSNSTTASSEKTASSTKTANTKTASSTKAANTTDKKESAPSSQPNQNIKLALADSTNTSEDNLPHFVFTNSPTTEQTNTASDKATQKTTSDTSSDLQQSGSAPLFSLSKPSQASTTTNKPPQNNNTSASPTTSNTASTQQSSTTKSANKQQKTTQATTSVWDDIIHHYGILTPSVESKPEVKEALKLLLSHKKTIQSMVDRSEPFIGYVNEQVAKKKMPSEIALLPFVESGYNPLANSSVGASGLWQMMPATATGDYRLNINWWYDERRDILISTTASLKYLNTLDRKFKNWMTAAAAYNVGQGYVSKSIAANKRAGKPTDFWDLSLPTQTKTYVPKLLAMAMIIKNAKQYGITLPAVSNETYFTSIKLNTQMDLEQISQLSGVEIDTIRNLNPGMRRWATSENDPYSLLLPKTHAEEFQNSLAKLTGKIQHNWQYHEVYGKETLSAIAHNYHTTTAIIAKVNGLSTTATLSEGQGLLVPIKLNKSYQSTTVKLPTSVTDSVDAISADELLSSASDKETDKAFNQTEAQMDKLKLNDDQPQSQEDIKKETEKPTAPESLKDIVDKVYQ